MTTSRLPHPPIDNPLPLRARRCCRAGLVSLIAVALVAPAAAWAQDDGAAQKLRARDLSVVENLLTETIQEAIQFEVQAINTENTRTDDVPADASQAPLIRFFFRSSGQTMARGMFLEDYGAVFTVQVPILSLTRSVFAFGDDSFTIYSGSPDGIIAGALAQEYQLKAQMSRMQAEIQDLTERLAQDVVEGGGELSENAATLRTAMNQLDTAYANYAASTEKREADARGSAEADRRSLVSPRGFGGVRLIEPPDPEVLARAEELANQQKNQIEGAVIEAVLDTLADYGGVIHGLEEDDRLAVVLLPSSYLSRVGSWSRATQRDEEFIISVRFRDILDLDEGRIDHVEFGRRMRVESRLGQPRR